MTLTGPPGVGKSRLAVETARSLEPEFPDGIWLVDFARAGDASDAVRLLATRRRRSRLRPARARDVAASGCGRARRSRRLRARPRRGGADRLDAPRGVSARADPGDEPRGAARRRRGAGPGRARSDRRGAVDSSSSVRGRRGRGSSRTPRPSRSRRRSRGAWTGCRSRSSSPPRASTCSGSRSSSSILERRAALLRDSPASDPSRTALQELVDWSYDLLHGDEKTLLQQLAVHRGGASLASLVAVAATHGLNEATVAYLVLRARRQVDRDGRRSPAARRATTCSTRVREYVLERLAESGGLAAARGAHAEYFAALADEARPGLRGPEWLRWERRLELENDNLWAALAYAQDAPDPHVAVRLGTLGWYFALADRVSEGRRFLELSAVGHARRRAARAARRAARRPLLPRDRRARSRRGARGRGARGLACRDRRGPVAAGIRATDARARRCAVRRRRARADAGADDAAATFDAAGDDWGIAASSAHPRRRRGARRRRRHRRRDGGDSARAFGRDRLRRVPRPGAAARGLGRGATGGAARPRSEAYRRALELAGRVGFGDHAAFALTRTRLDRARGRRPARGRGAPAAGARHRRGRPRAVASRPTHASQLARVAAASGDAASAERLYRGVLDWSQTQRPHQARESLFVALAGQPRRTAALLGLAGARGERARRPVHTELAEPRPRLAERWQRRRRAFVLSEDRRTGGSNEHNHDRGPAAEVRRRIDRLRARAADGAAERSRIQRHLDALHEEESSQRGAALPTRSRRGSGG